MATATALLPFTLALHFEVGRPIHNGICDDLQLTVNGQRPDHLRPLVQEGQSLESHISLPLTSISAQREHAVNLRVDSACSPLASSISPESGSSQGELFDVARIVIESIDNHPVSSQVVVNLQVLGEDHQVTTSLLALSSDTSDDPSRASKFDHEAQSQSLPIIEDEVERLKSLRGELKDLRHLVRQQAQYVNALKADDKNHHDAPHWPHCAGGDVKCRVTVFLQKAKHCVQGCAGVAIHHIFPSTKPTRPNDSAFVAQLQPEQMHTLTTHQNASRTQDAHDTQYTRLPVSDSDTDSLVDPEDAEIRFNAFKVALGTVASVFCLGVVCCGARRRCCSPRAKADRAARREERRTRREYRSLARRKAWKDWVRSRLSRGDRRASRRTNDYEEKRALILAQENVLEAAMQREITALERENSSVNDDECSISAAERGHGMARSRSHSNGTRSLPAYRSRASSGRPPSYTEIDHTAASSMTSLVGGFAIFPPSGTDPARDTASDVTPDSSIADLSPRHSSETLRTERSF
ncbi:MAG: hypothetical protein M1828_000525 [Chrysothrix sp. TS-e1954]|nr:MAG: hypothetical protein M1828_000525 [Chrysothrix sp. TS-e1954]